MENSSTVAETPVQLTDITSGDNKQTPSSPKNVEAEVLNNISSSNEDVPDTLSGGALAASEEDEEAHSKTNEATVSSGSDETSSDERDEEQTKKRDITGQRERKKVERLSESLNKSFELSMAKREKLGDPIKSLLEGHGTPLGDIPLIEASIRKTKPADLKILHYAAFGRLGSAAEVRANLRRFRGFTFEKSSTEYLKHEEMCNRKSVGDIRTALRQLNLEVSGGRTQIVARLLEFLLSPSGDMVKYHGKLHKKVHHTKKLKSKKSEDIAQNKRSSTEKPSVKAAASVEKTEKLSRKRKSTKNDSSVDSVEENVDTSLSGNSDEEEAVKSSDNDSIYSPGAKKTKKTTASLKINRKSIDSSPSPKNTKTKASLKTIVTPKMSKKTKKEPTPTATATKRRLHISDDSGDEDELPLASMIDIPSEETLKASVFEVLATANLKKDTMKVIRSSISAKYGGIDLSSKKDFIKNSIKEYLSHHYKSDSPSKDVE